MSLQICQLKMGRICPTVKRVSNFNLKKGTTESERTVYLIEYFKEIQNP